MTLQKPISRTAAEEAMFSAFENAMGSLPGDADMVRARDVALSTLRKAGLPTRRVEAWHYTDLRSALKTFPSLATKGDASALPDSLISGATIPFINGIFAEGDIEAMPEGVSVEAQNLVPELRKDNTISAINTAFLSESLAVTIAADQKIEAPINISHAHFGEEAHSAISKVDVAVGAGSTISIIEHHASDAERNHLVNAVSNVQIDEGAELTWVIMQEQGADVTHLAQLNVTLAKDAQFNLFIVNAGAQLTRQELNVRVDGEGADFQLRGINLLSGSQHCDVTMVLDHLPENTTSEQIVRNVLMDRAKGVFQGQIRVAKEAQKTDAKMACNTLLLSDDAEFSAKPELEIFADDVACGHGATVTEINPDHMFYLMARGVSAPSARGLLVKAFVAELLEELENEALSEALEERLDAWLLAQA